MLYKKPAGLKYTDCAIFIDAHIRDDDEKTRELCFEYMWHLFYVLAVKGKMFKNGRDYDEYASLNVSKINSYRGGGTCNISIISVSRAA